jgi:hypothetical protein
MIVKFRLLRPIKQNLETGPWLERRMIICVLFTGYPLFNNVQYSSNIVLACIADL